MLNAIWTDLPKMPSFPALKCDCRTDVLIIGGGLAGILCALQLERDGVDYLLIEADRICHGVTRNTTAKLTSQHGLIYDRLMRQFGGEAARLYWQTNEAALREYRRLAQNVDCDFETKDHILYATDFTESLAHELAALEQLGIPAEFTDRLPLPVSVTGAIRFRNQAQFHPLKFISAVASGLKIRERTRALAFEGNTVLTSGGRITAEKIVIATHFPMINKHGGYYLKMYQQRSYVLALKGAADVDGMYLDTAQNGLSFRNYGDLLLVGGGGHRTGKRGNGWAELEHFAARSYPDAGEICRWATQDCMTLDGLPYIGQYSKRTPDLFVATGFNKWGMTMSMAAAMLLGDLVQGRENPCARLFSPQRTVWRRQLFTNAAEAAVNFLTPVKPRCPHLGCALKWNSQERSWDCPCHGSRFAENGKLLNNPATGDLRTGGSA